MAIDKAWLDELVARTSLSALVGRAVTLKKAGREHKGCCPFHHEKTPSFTVNDDKGFYHCFGCSAHGDAIRWLVDHDGLLFIDAVKLLAEAAGMEVPARSPKAAERAARIDGIRPALDAAAAWYAHQLEQCGAAREYLSARGFGPDVVARFGLGWAPRAGGHVADIPGMTFEAARDSGLIWVDAESGRDGATFRERVMVPVHDARGRVIGFGGRVIDAGEPKYKNSPDSEIFDKGRVLFNLHRAAVALRDQRKRDMARGDQPTRLLIVEGYMDVIALDQAGFGWAVAPMGTAMTEAQLGVAWQHDAQPVVLMDGDKAGQAAAVRLAVRALPLIAPGQSLAFARLPIGMDPDDVLKAEGARGILRAVGDARGLAGFLFDSVVREAVPEPSAPEAVAGVWDRLAELGATIGHEELRAQYLAEWRRRFEREVSLVELPAVEAVHALIRSDDGQYAWPDAVDESERKLRQIVQAKLDIREERRGLTVRNAALDAVAKEWGFHPREINERVRELELAEDERLSREERAAAYRRALLIHGPMTEAMLPVIPSGSRGRGRGEPQPARVPAHRRLEQMVGLISDDVSGEAR